MREFQPSTMISAVREIRGLVESSEESYYSDMTKSIYALTAGFIAAFVSAVIILCWLLRSLRRRYDVRESRPNHPSTASPASYSPGQQHIPVHIYEAAAAAPAPSSAAGADTTSYNELQVCAICLCEFENGDCVSVLPRCKHTFHGDCIKMWVPEKSVNCPICRAPAVDRDESPATARKTTGRVAEMAGVENTSLSVSALLALNFLSSGMTISSFPVGRD